MGRPLHIDGRAGGSAHQAARFGRRLAKLAGIRLEFWDERLTSWEARELLGGSRREPGATDRLAAVLLLESYLAAHRP